MQSGTTQEEAAWERYKIISPILSALDESADRGKIALLKGEACALSGVSRKTLYKMFNRYAQSGFEGLKYQGTTSAAKRLIPEELVHMQRVAPRVLSQPGTRGDRRNA